jgi:hypothetical protein
MTLFDNLPNEGQPNPIINMLSVNSPIEFADKMKAMFSRKIGSFDTPKRLNRANLIIPEDYQAKIEDGTITSSDIVNLSSIVPIFRYKTCITIHGKWAIHRERIGGYKNIILNDNGSVELRYNAVDRIAKDNLAKLVKYARWSVDYNSQHDRIFKRYQTNDKDSAIAKVKELKEIHSANIDGITANVYVNGYVVWGTYIIDVEYFILSVHSMDYIQLACNICKVNRSDVETAMELEAQAMSAELAKKKALDDYKQGINNILADKYPIATRFEPQMIYVSYSGKPEFPYTFFQVGPKSSFGRFHLAYKVQNNVDSIPDTFPQSKSKMMSFAELVANGRKFYQVTPSPSTNKPMLSHTALNPSSTELSVQVTYNDKRGVDIKFNTKPSDEILNKLRAFGFRWSNKGHWWAYRNQATTMYAEELNAQFGIK